MKALHWKGVLFVFFLVCVAGGLLLKHPFFYVQLIQMDGNRFVEMSKLESHIESLGELPWIVARFGGVSNSLLSTFRPLDSVAVSGTFPHQIQLVFYEKKPWLSFYVEQDIFVIARDGTVLSQGDEMPLKSEEAVVYGVPASFFSEQGLTILFLEKMQFIMSALQQYFPYSNLQICLEGLYLGESGYQMNSWMLIKDDDIEIWMESLKDLPQRFKVLTHFFSSLTPSEEKAIDYIDMRVPTKLIIGYDTTQ